MRRLLAIPLLLLGLFTTGSAQTAPRPASQPGSQPATTRHASSGVITGTITTKDTLTRIVAIDRPWADVLKTSRADCKDPFVYEAKLDPATGTFTIPKLLPGRTYDLLVWTTSKTGEITRWEGVCMDYHRPILPTDPCTAEDRKWLEDWVAQIPQFYDKTRVLRIAADHKHATVVVELIRTRDFYADKGGEVIYRTELWYFENLFGGWAKDKNTEKYMVRWRGKGQEIPPNWQFIPQLGGISIDPATGAVDVQFTLPEQPDPKRGLVGGVHK